MPTYKIAKFKSSSGENAAPVTCEKAVYDDNGVRLDNKISTLAKKTDVSAKADKTYVDTQLASKASTSAVSEISTELTDFLKVDEVKGNGNIVLTDKSGNKKEYMAATPSGDPLHYAYVTAGAEYNATSADITKTAPWGESVTHKAGYWYLNGLGDLSNEDIRKCYCHAFITDVPNNIQMKFSYLKCRTNFVNDWSYFPSTYCYASTAFYLSKFEVICFGSTDISFTFKPYSVESIVDYCSALKHILGIWNFTNVTTTSVTNRLNANNLRTAWIINLGVNLKISSAYFEPRCVAYIINNAKTSAFTLTLHATAYANAMADADVTAALAAHTNVSLASA